MSQTTQNEEVRVHVERKPNCAIEMTVHVPASMAQEARKNAIRTVGKEITLPGFRKGKAPAETIMKKFPVDVEKQWHRATADLAYVAAQKIAKVPLLNNRSPISFDLKSLSDAGGELVFSFETEPEVPVVAREGFVPKPPVQAEVADKQVDEAIRQMRFFYAQWKPVQDRPIQDGDYIMINLDTVEGDKVEQVFRHVRFEVSQERMAAWMRKLVSGAKTGDVLEGVSEPDETASEAEKQEFKPKNIRLTLLKAEEAELPPLDDEFANKVGSKDVAHMRESVFGILNKQAEEKVRTELEDQVNDYLVKTYSFELPLSLVDTEKKHRFQQLMQDASVKESWAKMSQEERKKLDEKLAEEAGQAVRLFYLSRQIVQSANVPITHQEVQHEAMWLYQSHGGKNAKIGDMPQELYALALSKVMLAKAHDLILTAHKTA